MKNLLPSGTLKSKNEKLFKGLVFLPQETIEILGQHINKNRDLNKSTYFLKVGKCLPNIIFRFWKVTWKEGGGFNWESFWKPEEGFFYLTACIRDHYTSYYSFDMGFHGSDFSIRARDGEKIYQGEFYEPPRSLKVLIGQDPRSEDVVICQTKAHDGSNSEHISIILQEIL